MVAKGIGRTVSPSLTKAVTLGSGGGASTPAVPVNTVAPAISGTAITGSTLTCSTGDWTNSPTGYSYQWKRGSTNIGTNANTYALVSADVGQNITCVVTASNADGSGSPATSNTVVPLAQILAHVGTSTSPTSTGTKAVTGVGFEPKVVLPFRNLQNASGTALQSIMTLGAATNTSQSSISVSSNNGVTTSATARRHDGAKISSSLEGSGTLWDEATRQSFDADGFTLNWTAIPSATARILNHIALGGTDLEVSLTQHQMNNTNAAQSFAHGLSGAPTALIAFGIRFQVVPPTTTGGLEQSLGFWANGNHVNTFIASSNGATTTVAQRWLLNDCLVSRYTVRKLAVTSVDAVNVNCVYPVTATTNQDYFFMLAIRGAKAQVGTFDCNGSLDPLTIACPGITPKLFLPVFVPGGVSSINTVQNDLRLTIGACDGINNVSCGIGDQNAVTTTNARRHQSSSSLVEYDLAGVKLFEATASFVNESVVIDPSVNSNPSFGEGGYLVLGS